MPDLERWLTEIEGRHRVNDELAREWCKKCGQTWPCETITLARVVREQTKALETIKEKRDLSWDIVREVDQRIAAIIEGRDHE